ncbi:MAG TPA: hypothetical protein VMS62_01965, partial [Gemmatimonadales bacterium]|nr:hypothetical protein [Gemmatimonadales bacterium]
HCTRRLTERLLSPAAVGVMQITPAFAALNLTPYILKSPSLYCWEPACPTLSPAPLVRFRSKT